MSEMLRPDWTCPSCGQTNAAQRLWCTRCRVLRAPRPDETREGAGG